LLDKDKSRLPVAIKDIVIIGIGVLVVWLGIWIVFGGNPFYVVSSGSMEPVLKVNDVIIVRDGGSWQDLTIGDIIVFDRPEGGDRVIVHRIADIDVDANGERVVRTQGDANPASIPGTDYPIRQDDYIGKVIYVVPGIGVITQYIAPPYNFIIIAIILAILFLSRLGKNNTSSNNKDATPAAADNNSDRPPT
jgi:signal peptidase I